MNNLFKAKSLKTIRAERFLPTLSRIPSGVSNVRINSTTGLYTGTVETINGPIVTIAEGEWVVEESSDSSKHYPILNEVFITLYEEISEEKEDVPTVPGHVENALENMLSEGSRYIHIERKGNNPPVVSFTIQSDPVSEVGVNGCQVTDMAEYILNLYKSLNAAYPCRENALTITKIEEAIHWQEARTKDRVARNVEGFNIK